MENRMVRVVLIMGLAALVQNAPADEWKPVEGSMLTKWGEQLDSKSVWSEYPRPQLKREK
jgi:hypothetical protein